MKKIVSAVLVMFGVTTLTFVLFQGLGDPSQVAAGQNADQKTKENILHELELDLPIRKRFLHMVNDVSPLSFHSRAAIKDKHLHGFFWGNEMCLAIKWPYLGKSYQGRKPVLELLSNAFRGTLILATAAMLMAVFFGIVIGCWAALKKGSWIDRIALQFSVIGISVPSFFAAVCIAYFFGIYLHEYTGLHFMGNYQVYDAQTGEARWSLQNLVLPMITLGLRPMAIIVQMMRSSMIEVMSMDYIRTARAKGASAFLIATRHALPNAINPVITAITGWFAELLAGSFFIEYIFGWQGMGRLTINALEKLDYPVVAGAVIVSAFIFLLINLLTDFLYRYFDPRIALK